MKKLTVALMLSAFALAGLTASAEETQWQKDHPRRHEVNKRLSKQDKRINEKVANGEMSEKRAAKLHRKDHQIRQEERDMAAQNGGHITKQEQKTLNQQENKVSKEIGK
jgi:TolA-binding protein